VPLADQPLTLSAGSMVRYRFAELVDAAAHAGFAAISVTKRLRYLAHERDQLTDHGMLAAIRDHGLTVTEVEGTPGWLRGPAAADGRVLGFDEALELAAALAATGVVAYHDGRAGTGASDCVVEDFAAACDRAAERALTVELEFLPWSPVRTLSDAVAIVEAAGRPNGRVVLDSWHYFHSGQSSRSPSLSPAQARLVSCLQLADARPPETDDLVLETMFGRRVPGTGILDLPGLVARLEEADVRCPVSVEVYDETLAHRDARAYTSALAEGARHTLESATRPGTAPAAVPAVPPAPPGRPGS
jgi:sugar phosphate isomerase/epimerase